MGKTTCAAAFAVTCAGEGQRTLLISTDPAPSTGDALGQRLGPAPRRVKGASNLAAAEVNASRALARWLESRRRTLETIALRGTFLDQDDVATLLGLSLPGIDEIAALMEIARFGRSGTYDTVVVDTAPTGHTLRMLAMPGLLSALAVVFDRMHRKHRAIVEALRGRWTPDDADALIESIDAEGRELSTLLADRKRAVLTWVTLPEPMAVAESLDALQELRRLGVHVDAIVINRMTAAPDRACRWCDARRTFEGAAVRGLTARIGALDLRTVAARAREPRGVAALREIGREMSMRSTFPRKRVGATTRRVAGLPVRPGRAFSLRDREDIALLMFGGKGGVGKTTCAAATALRVAIDNPRRPVLLLSADPAHSLSDVLGVPLGDEPRHVPGTPRNLTAREIDAAARFDAVKRQFADAIDALFTRLTSGSRFELSADREAMRDLFELAPPGLDELMTIVEVSDALDFDATTGPLVVLDTAPSGHALRLLEMPALVHGWVKALMGIVLKYQPVVGVGELGAVLLRMSQGLGRLRTLLANPDRSVFIAVSRPAALPVAETRRLLKRLQALHIQVHAIVVNAWGAGTCSFCLSGRREQQRALAPLGAAARRRLLVIAPAIMPPPHGPESLRQWAGRWKVE